MDIEKIVEKLIDHLKELDSSISCTYFPAEEKYLVFTNSRISDTGAPKMLTGNFHYSRIYALTEAIDFIEQTIKERA